MEEKAHPGAAAGTDAGALCATSPATPPRLSHVDALRGFALLGIVLVNAATMAGPYGGAGPNGSLPDAVAAWLVTALASTKFYLLFSFLFGYSFTLQMRSAEREGAGFAARHLRRLLGLWCLGLAHAVLLFPGDILMTYAGLGLVLFAARNVKPRTALRAAAWLAAAFGTLLLAQGLLALVTPASQEAPVVVRDTVAAYRGSPASVVDANLDQWRTQLAGDLLYAPHMLAAFLTGLAAGGTGVFDAPVRYRARLRQCVAYGLPVGLAGSVFMAVCGNGPLEPRWSALGTAVGALTAPALTAAYAAGLVLLLRTRAGGRLGRLLAPAGRMALTNYLSQSLLLALVFTGYGLALYARVGAAAVVGGCLALYAAQLALSAWLLRRWRYGPVEWLLRSVTRGWTGRPVAVPGSRGAAG
ncbi:DUF418 domain-containing protein [Streptomyces diacarni]|nr:DUF418 domain-containing protein [Streptomyces diacarni]